MGFNKEWLNRNRKRGNPEAHLVLQILKYLSFKNHYCGKVKTKGSFTKQGAFILDRYQMIGLPDIFSFSPNGTFYAIECKAGKNILTPQQEKFKQLFHLPPTRIFITAYSLEDITQIIK
jgi:hypothetical protein